MDLISMILVCAPDTLAAVVHFLPNSKDYSIPLPFFLTHSLRNFFFTPISQTRIPPAQYIQSISARKATQCRQGLVASTAQQGKMDRLERRQRAYSYRRSDKSADISFRRSGYLWSQRFPVPLTQVEEGMLLSVRLRTLKYPA